MIETARLILRPTAAEDLDGWADLMGDPEASRFIGGPVPRAAAWRSLATMAGSWALHGFGMFSMIEKETGRWIGRTGPWRPEGGPSAEVGWGLLPSAWGRGSCRRVHNVQVDLHWPHRARVTFSLRERPVATIETPPVSNAAVALPPLIPFFSSTALARTLPRV